MKQKLTSYFYFLLFPSLIFTSCNNNDTYKLTVKGRVTDFYTGEGIANETVFVKDAVVNPSKEQIRQGYFDTTKVLGRIITDSKGNFKKTFEVEKGLYRVFVFNSAHISEEPSEIDQNFNSELNVKVKSFTKIKITLTNKNKVADSLLVTLDYGPTEYTSIINDSYVVRDDFNVLVYDKAIPETSLDLGYFLYMSEELMKTYPYYFSSKQNIPKSGILELAIDY